MGPCWICLYSSWQPPFFNAFYALWFTVHLRIITSLPLNGTDFPSPPKQPYKLLIIVNTTISHHSTGNLSRREPNPYNPYSWYLREQTSSKKRGKHLIKLDLTVPGNWWNKAWVIDSNAHPGWLTIVLYLLYIFIDTFVTALKRLSLLSWDKQLITSRVYDIN